MRYAQATAPTIEFGLGSEITYNGLTLNDSSQLEYVVRSIGGSMPEIRDTSDVNPSDHGSTFYDAFYGGRTLTIEGYIQSGNLARLRELANDLKAAFGRLDDQDLTFSTGYGAAPASIKCRTTGLSIEETQSDLNLRRNFQITMRAANPFITSTETQHAQSTFSDAILARVYDRTYDLAYSSLADADGDLAAANSFTLTNNGNFEARPRIQITGPVTNPSIANVTTGVTMSVVGSVAGGNAYILDIATREFYRTGNDPPDKKFYELTNDSGWLTIAPGENTLYVAGSGTTGASEIEFTFKDTWL